MRGFDNRVLLRAISASSGDLLIALTFLIVWIDPLLPINTWYRLPGPELVGHLVFGYFFEGIVIFVFGYFASLPYIKTKNFFAVGFLAVLGAILLYFLFQLSQSVGDYTPIFFAAGLVLNKFVSGVFETRDARAGMKYVLSRWGVMYGTFFGVMIPAAFIPWPQLGVEAWMAKLPGYPMSGEFVSNPQHAMAGGVMYFTILAVFEFKYALSER